jgi:dimethylhistidine N-methyltransferase
MTGPTPTSAPDDPTTARFAEDVRESLGRRPRELPSRYFYDPLGSALFDAICHLPWYRITRAESRLLDAHRRAMLQRLEPLSTIVELGPGNGEKLKRLLEGRLTTAPIDIHLVDVSSRALETAALALDGLENVRIIRHAAEYSAGLRDAASDRRDANQRLLVLFLGSNIGNFDPPCAADLLTGIRENVAPGDVLLLGTDLVKPEAELLLAYDDPLGVTATFNRNLLARINGELHGDFDLAQFAHEAVWNAAASRVEMYLVARSAQHVRIGAVGMELTMAAGERIWTESSYKYRPSEVDRMVRTARFEPIARWIDDEDGFMLTLAEASPAASPPA